MSTGAFSIDQLMELAGLSVSQAGTWPTSFPSSAPVITAVITTTTITTNNPQTNQSPSLQTPTPPLGQTHPCSLWPRQQRRRWPRRSPPPLPLRLPTHSLLPEAEQKRALPAPEDATNGPLDSLHLGLPQRTGANRPRRRRHLRVLVRGRGARAVPCCRRGAGQDAGACAVC
jgi:hypothetical protein